MTPSELLKMWRGWFPLSEAHTYVYAIQAGENGPVKIGVSTRPWDRLATLQTANPTRLRGIAVWRGSIDEERALHELLGERRLEGEWFQVTEDLLAFVELLGGGANCEFHRPDTCFWSTDDPKLPGVCKACDVQFFV